MIKNLNGEELIFYCDAKKVAQFAYAPYSKMQVGAALVTDNGKIFTGCNVENASFGLTICAERNAIGSAIKVGEKHFQKLFIYNDKLLVPPCGACLQVLIEFSPDCEVYLANDQEVKAIGSVNKLLPFRMEFKSNNQKE